MGKFITVGGTTSLIAHLFVQDATSTSGGGLTGLSFSGSGFLLSYIRPGDSAHTLVTKTGSGLNLGTYVSGAWLEVNSGTMPGFYEFHVPNAAVTTGASRVVFYAGGNAAMAPCPFEIQLAKANLDDGVRLGLTAIPNTIPGATAGIIVVGVGSGNLNPIAGNVMLQATTHAGATIPIVTTVANPVTITAGQLFIKRNSTMPGFSFLMTDTSTHGPKTGLTVLGQYSLTGGAFGNMASGASEIGSGWYKIDIAAGELNAPICSFRLTAGDADDRCVTFITQT